MDVSYKMERLPCTCEEDAFSTNSMPTVNSDSESSAPVSVRDMIRRYNTAVKARISVAQLPELSPARVPSQPMLPATKSSYCGINRYGSQSSIPQHLLQAQDTDFRSLKLSSNRRPTENSMTGLELDCEGPSTSTPKNSADYCCCQSYNTSYVPACRVDSATDQRCFCQSGKPATRSKSPSEDDGHAVRKVHSCFQSITSKRNLTDLANESSTDQPDDDNGNTGETSYQSRTTITKTNNGVRIIIDIFFDHEHTNLNPIDVVGSRIETNLPQSRILNEFQEQTALELP